ncbi:MAG: hypothetical protein ACTSQF_05855 [Candidatus Heimdallarchaeaceae archaeon]
MSNIKICGSTCGYINALIGGFILVIQGILTMIAQAVNALRVVGSVSFLAFTNLFWLNGLIMLILGVLVLFLVWDWLQKQTKTGPWIKDVVWLAIVLIVIGFITGGTGGIFVFVGGILYLVGQTKTQTV